MKNIALMFLFITSLVFNSCFNSPRAETEYVFSEPKQYVGETYLTQSFSVEDLYYKNLSIVGVANVEFADTLSELELNHFTRAFEEMYADDKAFLDHVLQKLKIKLNKEPNYRSVRYSKKIDGSFLMDTSTSEATKESVEKSFNGLSGDYIINVSKVTFGISKGKEGTRWVNDAGQGTMSMVGYSEPTFCDIVLTIQVWDKASRKRVLEFESLGEDYYRNFNLDKAFRKMLIDAVDYAVEYLRTGMPVEK